MKYFAICAVIARLLEILKQEMGMSLYGGKQNSLIVLLGKPLEKLPLLKQSRTKDNIQTMLN
jgi:hypothetical protein